MSGVRQGWLVARRELRERARSAGLWAGTAIMLLVVVAAIVVPAVMENDEISRDVGFVGATPTGLPATVAEQGQAVGITVRAHRYDDRPAGEAAVRDEDVAVLVVDGRRLEWRGDADERLRALLTGAIQLVAVQERAAAAGVTPAELAALIAPVEVQNEELGIAAGRSPDDETAAYLMSILLLFAVATYGQLVLTGVVQEKSSRVVEVLLARMSARTLLAGKIVGIGLLGFGQFVVIAVAALVATVAVDAVDIPAISADVLAWVVAWFVLGYALFAVAYGALGSLASRTEDASSIAAPVTTVLIAGYWASLLAVGGDPESGGAQLASLLPVTAPFAMPSRVALGATAWWEPFLSATIAFAAVGGLVVFAGRVYTGAILRTGATVKLGEAWRGTTASPALVGAAAERSVDALLVGSAVVLGATAYALTRDVIMSIALGAGAFAVGSRMVRARHGARD